MPLVYQQNINLNTRLGVWHITEDEEYFLKSVALQANINHPHKRLQHLAGRYLLRELFPEFPLELILIADTRKPFLEDEAFHFSISHCGDYAATIVSTHHQVGTDIEIPQAKIISIGQKFLSDDELLMMQALPVNTDKAYTIAWSIKEAIYKWYGAGQVDFKKHILIRKVNTAYNQYTVSCMFIKEKNVKLQVEGLILNGNCLSWVVD